MVILRWIFALPVIIICVFLAIANRQDISISLSPLHDGFDVPLYFFALCSVAIGFFTGSFLTWISTGKTRKERRQYKKELKLAQKELDMMKENTVQDTHTLIEGRD